MKRIKIIYIGSLKMQLLRKNNFQKWKNIAVHSKLLSEIYGPFDCSSETANYLIPCV